MDSAAGVNLIAFAPDVCERGHPLGPGRILVGHTPCICPSAINGGKHGHTWVRCEGCQADGVITEYVDPPCEARPQARGGPESDSEPVG